MLTYTELSKYFGSYLVDKEFKSFLANNFVDLTEYNILNSNYITSYLTSIELGFTNNDVVYDDDDQLIFEQGNPIFSHYNLFPKSEILIGKLPFDIYFTDTRKIVFTKAGLPIKTNQGHYDLLNIDFLVDSYKIESVVVTLDYNNKDESINSISVRDNNLNYKEQLKL